MVPKKATHPKDKSDKKLKKSPPSQKKGEAPFDTEAAPTEWLQMLAAISPVGIYKADKEGRCVWVNKKWIEMTGCSMKDALGFGWKQAVHPDDRELVVSEWIKATSELKVFQLEYRYLRPDGTVLHIYGRVTDVRDAEGKITGYIGVSTDISAMHRMKDYFDKESVGHMSQPDLTKREREVAKYIAAGDSNKRAADRLGLSVRTVESHRARIMRKLELTSLPELVRYAVRRGILKA